MKQFIKTRFFRTLQKTSQEGIDIDANVLKNEYDKFAILVFSKSSQVSDIVACRNSLI